MRPISQEERDRILELIREGKTHSQIYTATRRTSGVVDQIAQEAGLEVTTPSALGSDLARNAREAKEAQYKDRLQKLRHDLSTSLERLHEQLWQPAEIFGGKDFERREIAQPLFGDKRAIVQALDIGQRVLLNLEKMREQDAGRRVMLDILVEMRRAEQNDAAKQATPPEPRPDDGSGAA